MFTLPSIDDQGWLKDASRCPSPNFNERPQPAEVSLLVIHNISLPPAQFGSGDIEKFFCNQLDPSQHPYFETICNLEVSAHCLVARDGQVTQFVSFEKRAWHAGKSEFEGRGQCNDYSIGIELEGTDDLPYTDEQYQVLANLADCLLCRYPHITAERIVGHSDIAPGRKTDPGSVFDWKRFRDDLKSMKNNNQHTSRAKPICR